MSGPIGSIRPGSAHRPPVFPPPFSPSALRTTSNNDLLPKNKAPVRAGAFEIKKTLPLEVIGDANRRCRKDLVPIGIEDVPRQAESWGLHQKTAILRPYVPARAQLISHTAAKEKADVCIPFRVEVRRS